MSSTATLKLLVWKHAHSKVMQNGKLQQCCNYCDYRETLTGNRVRTSTMSVHLIGCNFVPFEDRFEIGNNSKYKQCIKKARLLGVALPSLGEQQPPPPPEPDYFTNKYIDNLLHLVPIKCEANLEFASLSTKERESSLEQQLRTLPRSELKSFRQKATTECREFWIGFRSSNPNISDADFLKIRQKCNARRMVYRREQQRKIHGVNWYGNLLPTTNKIPFQPGTFNHLPYQGLSFVPALDIRKMPCDLIRRVDLLDNNLQELLVRQRSQAGRKRDRRDSNQGYSIALTVAPGGKYGDKESGISGSIHLNRNIIKPLKKNTEEKVYCESLQKDVIETVADVIEYLYGNCPWYRAVVEKLADIPRTRFLPGRNIPCSHIWYTSDPQVRHVHTDTNTLPPAFVFCPKTVKGGDLIVAMPDGSIQRVCLNAGVVAGGSWAQYPHCNEKVSSSDRRSFVVYLDHRSISQSYIPINLR